ncbi:MAG: DUF2946 family protein [Burkholderiaceae bacterium]|nr:DUF2946 family protein [Burkholderiaceae bacterium]
MDEIVKAAMRKWPNVPDCYAWLHLDARGRWRIGAWPGEPITHVGLKEFIGRNYQQHIDGSYIFQNGPQRVFVRLAYTPYVYRLSDAHSLELTAHSGQAAGVVQQWFQDEQGHVLAQTALGIGLLDGSDMNAFVQRCEARGGLPEFHSLKCGEVAARFGFVQNPQPSPSN